MQNNRIAFLDWLRFIAASIVILAHLYSTSSTKGFNLINLETFFYGFFHSGVSGVIIFFLISGYIIPIALERHSSIKHFIINRVFRIYPLFIFLALISMAFYSYDNRMFIGLFLPIANLFPLTFISKTVLHNVDWTLRLEFQFYFIIAWVYFKYGLNYFTLTITTLLCLLLSSLNLDFFNIPSGSGKHTHHLQAITPYNCFLFLGVYFYMLQKKFSWRGYVGFTVMLFLSIILFEIIRPNSFKIELFAVVSFSIFYIIHQFPKIRIKSNKVSVFLGDATYASYLLHLMIYEDLYKILHSHILTYIVFIAICYCAYKFIEKPGMVMAKQKFLKRLV